MDNQYSPNFNDQNIDINPNFKPKKKKKIFKKIFLITLLFLAIFYFFTNGSNNQNGQEKKSWIDNIPIIGNIKTLVQGATKPLKGESRNRINILLLGIGGKNHDGGNLTDTIMVVSIEPSTKKIAMISIPRDLTVPVENMGWRKINSINAYAEMANDGSGGVATSQAVSDILNIPIDYYIRLDFKGFINVIDKLGGVDVYVENTLDDYSYPILGKEDVYPYESRYEHLHVEKGWQKMDGDLALKFARSRHGINGEGSDFARARRQQKIIEAAKEKSLSMKTLLNPSLVAGIFTEIKDNISTNLKVWEIIKLWSMVKDIKSEDIINKVLDNGPGGYLVNSISSEGAYILTPKSGDFNEIQYLVNNLFSATAPEEKAKINQEKSSVEIHNGTWINGLASRIATDLEMEGFKILLVGNSSRKDFQNSVIYDFTNGNKNDSLTLLKDKLKANISSEIPQWLTDEINERKKMNPNFIRADFIIILGQSADDSESGIENSNE